MQLINVMASSVDGRIALSPIEGDATRIEVGLSSEQDHAHLKNEIGMSDAIIVGAGSIRSNQECLDYPGISGLPPTWYIFAESEIPSCYNFWKQDSIRRVIISSKQIPIYSNKVEFHLVSGNLAKYAYSLADSDGCARTLLFGGGRVNSWFYRLGLVDQLKLTLAPVIVARGSSPYLVFPDLPDVVDMTLESSQVAENFVFLNYNIKRMSK